MSTLLSRASSRRASQLELFLEGETIVELTRRVFSRLGHFLHKLFRFNDGFENFPFVGLAELATDKHFKENEQRLVQGKDQIQFAD